MEILRTLNLALRFALELGALAAFGYWAATMSVGSALLRALAAMLATVVVALFWAAFVSPKARFPSGRFGPVVLGLVVFLIAAALLAARHHTRLATGYAALAVASSLVLYRLPQLPIAMRNSGQL